jgi:beta-lactamase regulating signal transducer with metallopeptidase domain
MNAIREIVFDWLFNASVQIGLFAILAAVLSPFLAKAKANYQHWLYLAIFALCLAAPVFNTLWQSRPSLTEESIRLQSIPQTEQAEHNLWGWKGIPGAHKRSILVAGAKTTLLAMWLLLFLYRFICFSRGIYRVYRVRRDAMSISASEIGMVDSLIEPPHPVALRQSTAIDDPVTVGVFRPAILLPSKVLPALNDGDLAAILAHEYGHIRRKDFLAHVCCQLFALPVAWHPGIWYLMSKLSQTRELACDDYAAVRLGKRIVYARTLLRLASLCLQLPRSSNAMGLGIFDGDNLEDRIMKLTQKRTSLSRAGLIGLVLTTTFPFGAGTVLARAVSLQEAATFTSSAQKFAGTWHRMFQGHSFSTMILVQSGYGITGTVTPSKIALGDDGELSRADPSDDSAPTPIIKTTLEGHALRVTVGDREHPFEFLVTLKDASHAEIHPVGAPSSMKPIEAERGN